ncbi:MAG: hypothetical protein K9H58_10485 [Bacteroidales bacterium]|nr:hypothetical protein [Bacteroidales bacterium]
MHQTKTNHPEHGYKKGLDRSQGFLLPPSLEDLVEADSQVRPLCTTAPLDHGRWIERSQ